MFLVAGMAIAALLVVAQARRRGRMDDSMLTIIAAAVLCGAIGAKLGTAWRYFLMDPDPSMAGALTGGGKTVLGGLAGAYLGVVVAKKAIGYRESTGDMFAPAVALGMAIGRWGCFLTEPVGTATSLPWGIRVDAATAARLPDCPACAAGLPMHPSFLYEIAFQLAIFVVLVRLRGRLSVPGDLFKIYLIAYAVFRFAVEFVRTNEVMWAGLTGPQLFLIPSALVLLAYFGRQIRLGAYRTPATAMQPAV